uniref:Uncharacterized protein n=1 Tax=Tanacetum cinerariifolium TaxID=118510 RepID=A0A6L2J0G1_TANCI|nr:hypothetical protein [Tanacetum cinerariifolium]
MLFLAVQHNLFHLDDNDIVDFVVALRMFIRSLIIKGRIKDLQLGVESYQKKLNITEPQKRFLEIKFKELYTPSHKPPGVIYEDLNKQKRNTRFLSGIQQGDVKEKVDGYRKRRSELMVELSDKQMRERKIILSLKRLVGARELEMDYKLMTRTV